MQGGVQRAPASKNAEEGKRITGRVSAVWVGTGRVFSRAASARTAATVVAHSLSADGRFTLPPSHRARQGEGFASTATIASVSLG